MRILIFTQYFWPEDFRINALCEGLLKRGNQIDVITGKPNYPSGIFFPGYTGWGFQREEYKNINIYRLPMTSRKNASKLNLMLNYISFFLSALIFAPLVLKSKKYDRIFVFGVSPIFQVVPASLIGWMKSAKVVLWVQDLWPDSVQATGYIKSSFFLAILKSLVRFSYARADLILVQSKAFFKHVSDLAPQKTIKYYPNSVESNFYNPERLDCPLIKSLENGFSVLFAGNVGVAQSVETIADTSELLRNYPEIKIVILGSGSMSDWLAEQKRIRKLNNLYLEGRYPFEVMPLLMRKASVLLVSLTDKPIFSLTVPSKLQAYLSIGKPLVGSLNGEGANLITEAKAGISAPAGSASELAKAIVELYEMTDDQRYKMGVNARRYFKKHFDSEMLIDDLVEILNAL